MSLKEEDKDFVFCNDGNMYRWSSVYFSYEEAFPATAILIRKKGDHLWKLGEVGRYFSGKEFESIKELNKFWSENEVWECDPLGQEFDPVIGMLIVRYCLRVMLSAIPKRRRWIRNLILYWAMGIEVQLSGYLFLPSFAVSQGEKVKTLKRLLIEESVRELRFSRISVDKLPDGLL